MPTATKHVICKRPFTDITLERDGALAPCCLVRGSEMYTEKDLDRYWASPVLARLQQTLMRNEQAPECKVCWRTERAGLKAHRMAGTIGHEPYDDVHLKIGNICNHKCRICGPIQSTAWIREIEARNPTLRRVYGDVARQAPLEDPKVQSQIFERVLPRARSIRITGGEPLVTRSLFKVFEELDRLGKNTIPISIITNLSRLTLAGTYLPDYWDAFPNLHLIASCDGAGEEVEYSRTGLVWEQFMENVRRTKRHIRSINCVVNVFSVLSIPQLLIFCLREGIHLHLARAFSDWNSIYVLGHDERAAIAQRYDSFCRRAQMTGVPDELIGWLRRSIVDPLFVQDASQTAKYIFRIHNDSLDCCYGTDFRSTFPKLAQWYNAIDLDEATSDQLAELESLGLLEPRQGR